MESDENVKEEEQEEDKGLAIEVEVKELIAKQKENEVQSNKVQRILKLFRMFLWNIALVSVMNGLYLYSIEHFHQSIVCTILLATFKNVWNSVFL